VGVFADVHLVTDSTSFVEMGDYPGLGGKLNTSAIVMAPGVSCRMHVWRFMHSLLGHFLLCSYFLLFFFYVPRSMIDDSCKLLS
jgi:hypothetical protein